MTNVQEAAEKLRSLTYRGLGEWRTPSGESLDEEDVNKLRAELASEFLELDDAELLDEAWLRSVGLTTTFSTDTTIKLGWWSSDGDIGIDALVRIKPNASRPKFKVSVFGKLGHAELEADEIPRGDLRALLKGLKVCEALDVKISQPTGASP